MSVGYDTVLKGGRVIDPAADVDGCFDIAVSDGRIAAVETDIDIAMASEVVDVNQRLVLPGLIDSHAHVFEHVVGRFGLNPDSVGVRSGVTTLVDQGCASFMSMEAFRRYVVDHSQSRIFSFVSIYAGGEGHLSADMAGAGIDADLCIKCIEGNRDLVRGVKVNAEIGSMSIYGLEKVKAAKRAAREGKVPLYVHLGQLFKVPNKPRVNYEIDQILPDVVALLEPGDIMAHPFSRHPGGFVSKNGQVQSDVFEARARGVKIDVGHGSHFSFDVARRVLDAGIVPDTLGGDLHGYNTRKPVSAGVPEKHPDDEMAEFSGDARFSLVHAMTELLALGITIEQIVPMVTSRCADVVSEGQDLGTLREGQVADVTVLADERGKWELGDNDGTVVTAERLLRPLFCLRAGRMFESDSPILPNIDAA